MERKYIRAESKRDGRRIQGLFANDDGRAVYIIQDGEPWHCMHELFNFFLINEKGVVIGKYEQSSNNQ